MRSYVSRMNGEEGYGHYVLMYADSGELVDHAGPFDDEYDAEMVKRRADEWAE